MKVTLGAAYRIYDQVANYYDIPTKTCYKVTRGGDLSPVWSCEGLGDPAIFYVKAVFALSSITAAFMFLTATEMR